MREAISTFVSSSRPGEVSKNINLRYTRIEYVSHVVAQHPRL